MVQTCPTTHEEAEEDYPVSIHPDFIREIKRFVKDEGLRKPCPIFADPVPTKRRLVLN